MSLFSAKFLTKSSKKWFLRNASRWLVLYFWEYFKLSRASIFFLITLESCLCLYSRSFGNRQQNIHEYSVIFWSEISSNWKCIRRFSGDRLKTSEYIPIRENFWSKYAGRFASVSLWYHPTALACIQLVCNICNQS